ncbi:hypothetical protein MAQA_11916 [Listeria aquatica FSL S10-1188]|uniref:Uncharacterized protein n=1 Tax=Listeria aquatica FSL S10-1188 TaxID=1265818 RepID=W7AWV4_9LIST|nr:hypothetical protein MAQA_11916 [Listeria aquatica FSL S10-1188]
MYTIYVQIVLFCSLKADITLNYHLSEVMNSNALAAFKLAILSFERDDNSLIEFSLIESNRRI